MITIFAMTKGEEKNVMGESGSGDYSLSIGDLTKGKIPSEEAASIGDDEDLSLGIVQKSLLRTVNSNGSSEIVMNSEEVKKKRKRGKKNKNREGIDVPANSLDVETDKEKQATEQSIRGVHLDAGETIPVESADNSVLRKLLRGPRYFDPPDNNSWGTCYNCGEEGHTTVSCTSARRKKPCFVCGSLEHNAKQCSKGRDCFICKQHGHRAKDCPEKNKSFKICLKCGDPGHDMFSCRNDYHPDDLKEIQCYVCGKFGHLCCQSYTDPGPAVVTCYRCGSSGHTGLACVGLNVDKDGLPFNNSCYKCGLEGHFARECTNSVKSAKRRREPSTPKQRYSKKGREWKKVKSAPHDLGKKKKSRDSEFALAAKTKRSRGWKTEDPGFSSVAKARKRGGWLTEDPGFNLVAKARKRGGWMTEDPGFSSASKAKKRGCWMTEDPGYRSKPNTWKSPATPSNRRSKISSPNSDYASSSRSSKKPRKLNFNDSGSSRGYRHKFSASRFGSNKKEGRRSYGEW